MHSKTTLMISICTTPLFLALTLFIGDNPHYQNRCGITLTLMPQEKTITWITDKILSKWTISKIKTLQFVKLSSSYRRLQNRKDSDVSVTEPHSREKTDRTSNNLMSISHCHSLGIQKGLPLLMVTAKTSRKQNRIELS